MPELVDGLDSKSSALGHVGSSPTAPTFLMDTYNRFPISFIKGKGCWLWDSNGKKYLDAVSGIATCSLGHSNQALHKALNKQLKRVQHVSNLYVIPEQEKLAKWLVEHSCADKVFFCNSGAEANEAAIKLARKYGHTVRHIKRPLILTCHQSFHGRTLAAISATGQPKFHKGFEPLVDGFQFFPYNNKTYFEELITKIESDGPNTAAILIEPLQGEGGVNPGEKIFFKRLREFCDKYRILLIFDEVQVGMGRTGSWWGYQRLGVEPDAFTLAKGLGGGHAIGALLVKEHANIFSAGDHASTFGGNPFACIAGLTVATEIEKKDLLSNARRRGEEINQGLKTIANKFPNDVKEIRGWGLIQGIELNEKSNISASKIVTNALSANLLVATSGSKVIRIIPPLIINPSEVKELIKRLNYAFDKCK